MATPLAEQLAQLLDAPVAETEQALADAIAHVKAQLDAQAPVTIPGVGVLSPSAGEGPTFVPAEALLDRVNEAYQGLESLSFANPDEPASTLAAIPEEDDALDLSTLDPTDDMAGLPSSPEVRALPGAEEHIPLPDDLSDAVDEEALDEAALVTEEATDEQNVEAIAPDEAIEAAEEHAALTVPDTPVAPLPTLAVPEEPLAMEAMDALDVDAVEEEMTDVPDLSTLDTPEAGREAEAATPDLASLDMPDLDPTATPLPGFEPASLPEAEVLDTLEEEVDDVADTLEGGAAVAAEEADEAVEAVPAHEMPALNALTPGEAEELSDASDAEAPRLFEGEPELIEQLPEVMGAAPEVFEAPQEEREPVDEDFVADASAFMDTPLLPDDEPAALETEPDVFEGETAPLDEMPAMSDEASELLGDEPTWEEPVDDEDHPLGPLPAAPFEEADFSVVEGQEEDEEVRAAFLDSVGEPNVYEETEEEEDQLFDFIQDPEGLPGEAASQDAGVEEAKAALEEEVSEAEPEPIAAPAPDAAAKPPKRPAPRPVRDEEGPNWLLWGAVAIILILVGAFAGYRFFFGEAPQDPPAVVQQTPSTTPSTTPDDSTQAGGMAGGDTTATTPTPTPATGAGAISIPYRGGIDVNAGGYTVIVSSEELRVRAEQEAAAYASLNQPIDIIRGEAEGRVRYRVAVGQFATLGAANQFKRQNASTLPNDAWIVRLRAWMTFDNQ